MRTPEDVARAVGVTPTILTDRLAAIGLDPQQRAGLRAAAPEVAKGTPAFLDALYARLRSHPDTAALLGNDHLIDRLKTAQSRYLAELFGADLDWSYALGRLWTGVVHHRVRLSPRWYVATYAHFVCDHVTLLLESAPSRAEGIERVLTFVRTVLFDASLVLDSYGRSEEVSTWSQAQNRDPRSETPATAQVDTGPVERSSDGPQGSYARIRLTTEETHERRAFVGLTQEDLALLRTLRTEVVSATPGVLDDFYRFVTQHPETASLVPQGSVGQLKQLVTSYWIELVEGAFDRPYAASRMRVGVIHEKIGLAPPWYLIGLARQVTGFLRALTTGPADPARVVCAFVRAVFFDVSFVIDAYLEARTTRLMQTEAYANQLVSGLASAVAVFDAEDRVISANRTLVSLVGGDPSLLYLMPIDSAVPVPEAGELVRRARREERDRIGGMGRLGERTLQLTAMRLSGKSDTAEGAIALVMDDVTEVLRVAEDMRTKSRQLDEVANSVDVVLWEIDERSWVISAINRAVLDVTGYRDVYFLGRERAWLECIVAEDRMRFTAAVTALEVGGRVDLDYRLRHADGHELWVRSRIQRQRSGTSDCLLAATTDISAARLEEHLRLEALGRVAGGVAHVVNNALTVVLGNLEIQSDLLGGPAQSPLLATAAKAGERAVAMTRQLLAFSRRQMLRALPVALAELVRRAVPMLRTLVGPAIEVESRTSSPLWLCRLDPDVLETALGCLASNAREAMQSGGMLRISTENTTGAALAPTDPAFGRDWVELVVADDGIGMTEDVRARAVEPFFSTRANATGLGLSMVYGFVAQSGGHLVIESMPGKGTTVRMRFPRMVAPKAGDAAKVAPANGYSVLLVEDDAMVREVTARIVASFGFEVREATDSASARAAVRAQSPDILIVDVVLANGEDGIELARELVERDAELSVIAISGYSASHFDLGSLPASAQFLAKPFSAAELDRCLRVAMKNGV